MIDFLRDSNNDLSFDGIRFTPVNDKAIQLKQRIKLRLLRFAGEWFLDVTKGVQYKGVMNVKNPNVEVINNMLKSEVLKESGVTEIIEWNSDIDPRARRFIVLPTTKVKTDTGQIIEFGAEL